MIRAAYSGETWLQTKLVTRYPLVPSVFFKKDRRDPAPAAVPPPLVLFAQLSTLLGYSILAETTLSGFLRSLLNPC